MSNYQEFAARDKFARACGCELLDASPGYAKAQVVLNPAHHNSFGTAHGGLLFTLADFVFAIACNSYGPVAMAINVSINYLQAKTEGVLTAEAREISLNRKLGTYQIDITDGDSELVATFTGTAYRKSERVTS